jgi:hypothetical protein
VGSVGRLLLERVTLLLSKLASLRERSESPLPRIKLAHQIPKISMSDDVFLC